MGQSGDHYIDNLLDYIPPGLRKRQIRFKRPTCQTCGKNSLMWDDSEGHWRLLELNGSKHNCELKNVFKNCR